MDMTGWTKYDGTGQPVPDGTVVEIFLRQVIGWDSTPERAECCNWDWKNDNTDGDILYYKVIE